MLATLLQTSAPSQGSPWSMWIMLILVFVSMWLFMIRPQRKQQKMLEEMRNSLKKGDKVVTAGGIYGTVADIDEKTVLMKVDGDVKIRVDKQSIQKDMSESAPSPAKKDQGKDKAAKE